MKKLFKYLTRVRKDLLVLLVIALFTYFSIDLIFINYNEAFYGAYKIGQFLIKLAMSYISAFIFYFFVVHIKNEKDKNNIHEYIGLEVYSIITNAYLFIKPFQQENNRTLFKDIKIENLGKLLKTVEKNALEAPYSINGQNVSWLQYFEFLKESTENSLNRIFSRYNYLDTELIKILNRIENSIFFSHWPLLYMFDYDKTFGIYETQLKTYIKLIASLESYAEKKLKEYKKRTSEFVGFTEINN